MRTGVATAAALATLALTLGAAETQPPGGRGGDPATRGTCIPVQPLGDEQAPDAAYHRIGLVGDVFYLSLSYDADRSTFRMSLFDVDEASSERTDTPAGQPARGQLTLVKTALPERGFELWIGCIGATSEFELTVGEGSTVTSHEPVTVVGASEQPARVRRRMGRMGMYMLNAAISASVPPPR